MRKVLVVLPMDSLFTLPRKLHWSESSSKNLSDGQFSVKDRSCLIMSKSAILAPCVKRFSLSINIVWSISHCCSSSLPSLSSVKSIKMIHDQSYQSSLFCSSWIDPLIDAYVSCGQVEESNDEKLVLVAVFVSGSFAFRSF